MLLIYVQIYDANNINNKHKDINGINNNNKYNNKNNDDNNNYRNACRFIGL